MKVKSNRWQVSSRDIWAGIHCIDHCLQLAMAKAVELPAVMERIEGTEMAGGTQLRLRQGVDYENSLLAQLAANLGDDYVKIPDHSPVDQTLLFTRMGKAVIAQAPLINSFEEFDYVARADLLVRSDMRLTLTEAGELSAVSREGATVDGLYNVWDIKHSSAPKEGDRRERSDVNREAQLAMSFEALLAMGIGASDHVGLVFKGAAMQVFDPNKLLDELKPLRELIFERITERTPSKKSALSVSDWRCPEPVICSKASVCDYPQICKKTRFEIDDLSLVPNMDVRRTIPKYKAIGVETVAKLASADIVGTEISKETIAKHVKFAKCATLARELGRPQYFMEPGISVWTGENPLPKATKDDLFLDMESFQILNGQVFYYMVGVMNQSGDMRHFIADSPEKQDEVFLELVQFLELAFTNNSDMNVYVVSQAEKTMFERLDDGRLLGDARLAALLGHVLDVQLVASKRLIVSTGSFGLKEMEPFFREAGAVEERDTETSDGDDSQWQYYLYLQAKKNGDLELADKLMADIKRYNSQDCINTKHYYDWLASIG